MIITQNNVCKHCKLLFTKQLKVLLRLRGNRAQREELCDKRREADPSQTWLAASLAEGVFPTTLAASSLFWPGSLLLEGSFEDCAGPSEAFKCKRRREWLGLC